MRTDTKIVPIALTIWFCFALAIGIAHWFESASALIIAVTVWTMTGLVLLGQWKVPAVNQFTRQVDLSWLIGLHLTRFVGIYFLILCNRNELSCAFARPAGIGDVVVAVGAALLLLLHRSADRNVWRIGTFAWNIFGLLDIMLVVFKALRVGLHDWAGMAALRTLPLMLLPTFLVPLIIASHIFIFVRLRAR